MSYLNDRADTLKAEYEYIAGLHKENPTGLKESYMKGKEYSEKAFKVAELLEKKKKEIDEFLFFHPEYSIHLGGLL